MSALLGNECQKFCSCEFASQIFVFRCRRATVPFLPRAEPSSMTNPPAGKIFLGHTADSMSPPAAIHVSHPVPHSGRTAWYQLVGASPVWQNKRVLVLKASCSALQAILDDLRPDELD